MKISGFFPISPGFSRAANCKAPADENCHPGNVQLPGTDDEMSGDARREEYTCIWRYRRRAEIDLKNPPPASSISPTRLFALCRAREVRTETRFQSPRSETYEARDEEEEAGRVRSAWGPRESSESRDSEGPVLFAVVERERERRCTCRSLQLQVSFPDHTRYRVNHPTRPRPRQTKAFPPFLPPAFVPGISPTSVIFSRSH